ncbi:MAG: hypothetical protein RMJ98_10885 [Myxococcales bacterium]|nr:hypothetical protein [Polyangiaceae bacterium]MDW8249791.1 hypothetical protein [Myxococcales bacterium]
MSPRCLLPASLLLLACCPAPKDDTEPAFQGPAASSSSLPFALDPTEPISVEMARNRGEYKGAAQLRVTRFDQRVQETSQRLQHKPDQARALTESHWALVRAFKAVEASDEASFPEARDRFEQAASNLEAALARYSIP